MSGTYHHRGTKRSEQNGHEYWTRRSGPPGKAFRQPGAWSKRMLHRKERRNGKQDAAGESS